MSSVSVWYLGAQRHGCEPTRDSVHHCTGPHKPTALFLKGANVTIKLGCPILIRGESFLRLMFLRVEELELSSVCLNARLVSLDFLLQLCKLTAKDVDHRANGAAVLVQELRLLVSQLRLGHRLAHRGFPSSARRRARCHDHRAPCQDGELPRKHRSARDQRKTLNNRFPSSDFQSIKITPGVFLA